MSVKSWPAEPVIYAGIVSALLLWRLVRPHARNRKPVSRPRGEAMAVKK
jgi:sulfoxide reductase heme-binding subunit YedZ